MGTELESMIRMVALVLRKAGRPVWVECKEKRQGGKRGALFSIQANCGKRGEWGVWYLLAVAADLFGGPEASVGAKGVWLPPTCLYIQMQHKLSTEHGHLRVSEWGTKGGSHDL